MKIISRQEAIEKNLTHYFTGKPCKHGHISQRYTKKSTCIQCKNESYDPDKNKSRCKEYQRKNREVIREKSKEYREKNAEEIKAKKAAYFQKNKEILMAKNRENISKNRKANLEYHRRYSIEKKHIRDAYKKRNKKRIAEYKKQYKKENPLDTFTRNTLTRLERSSGGSKYEELIGYTQDEFISHIESQFVEGMSWDNRSQWHVDHIKPVSVFIKEGVKDIKIINALSNLQPLWAKDNQSKGAKH